MYTPSTVTVRVKSTQVMLKKSPLVLKKFKAKILPPEAPDDVNEVIGDRIKKRRNSRYEIKSEILMLK